MAKFNFDLRKWFGGTDSGITLQSGKLKRAKGGDDFKKNRKGNFVGSADLTMSGNTVYFCWGIPGMEEVTRIHQVVKGREPI